MSRRYQMSAAASAARAKDLLRENENAPDFEPDSSNEGSKSAVRATRSSPYENGPKETKSEKDLEQRDSYGSSDTSNTVNRFPNATSLPPEILGLYNRTEGHRAKEQFPATGSAPQVAFFPDLLALSRQELSLRRGRGLGFSFFLVQMHCQEWST